MIAVACRCGTIRPGDVEACPACQRTECTIAGPSDLGSSLGPLYGEASKAAFDWRRTRFTTPLAELSSMAMATLERDQADEIEQVAGGFQHTSEDPFSDDIAAGRTVLLPLSVIDPSPYQRRKHFDAEALEQLAASIAEVGLLQPIVVRPRGKFPNRRFEIVAGERRFRATKLAKARQIRATLRHLSDEQAARACARENLDREDLNPIEEAESLKVLLDVGGMTQDELAAELKRTQGWISNRLRLLDLPEPWLGRVISQEIPATHARELVRWKHRPAVLEAIAATLMSWQQVNRGSELPTVKDFQGMIRQAAAGCSKSLEPHQIAFKLTKANREALDVEQVENYWNTGKELRAFNVAKFRELQRAGRREQREAAAVETKASPASSSRDSLRNEKRPYSYQVCGAVGPWLGREILARLKPTQRDLCLRLLLSIGIHSWEVRSHVGSRDAGPKLWRALSQLDAAKLARLPFDLVAAELKGDRSSTDPRLLSAILADLGGEPRAYPLTAKDLELYSDRLLRAMPPAKGLEKSLGRKELIAEILKRRDGWLPSEFAEQLGPKPERKRKAK